ncbi:MAG TPA: histidine phosphatase family protein [Mycobacterium sp.]|nr:histidine phosphatase family protein [Mycobacterium sp.]
MTEVVRLTLVSHAMTDAMAAGRFPADEPLNDTGRRLAEAVAALDIAGDTRQLTGPERRARQTAQLLGLQATTEPRLADLDCGRWRGEALANIGPADLEAWLTEPAHAPHGGESIADLIQRVDAWLESLTDNTFPAVAVTHSAVIRAAILLTLDAPPKSFWRIDIAPLGRTVMHFRGGRWTLRL